MTCTSLTPLHTLPHTVSHSTCPIRTIRESESLTDVLWQLLYSSVRTCYWSPLFPLMVFWAVMILNCTHVFAVTLSHTSLVHTSLWQRIILITNSCGQWLDTVVTIRVTCVNSWHIRTHDMPSSSNLATVLYTVQTVGLHAVCIYTATLQEPCMHCALWDCSACVGSLYSNLARAMHALCRLVTSVRLYEFDLVSCCPYESPSTCESLYQSTDCACRQGDCLHESHALLMIYLPSCGIELGTSFLENMFLVSDSLVGCHSMNCCMMWHKQNCSSIMTIYTRSLFPLLHVYCKVTIQNALGNLLWPVQSLWWL